MRTLLISKLQNIFNININFDNKIDRNDIYGAKELKGILSSNVYKSFGIVISSLVLFMGVYVSINGVEKSIDVVRNLDIPPIVIDDIPIPNLPPKDEVVKNKSSNSGKKSANANNSEANNITSKGATNPDGKGVFTPTNKDVVFAGMGTLDIPFGKEVSDMIGDFAKETITKIGGGSSIGNGGGSSEDDIEFQAVEFEPKLDMSKLQGLIEYPTIARKSNIEGRVIIKVLVKSDGSVGKYMVEHSENIMLNIAALEAITKYGKFVPAIQNGKTVDCWISIPINFRLR